MGITPVLRVNPDDFAQEELAPAGRILREGGLVVFPTETVYGLGANALDETAARAIYTAKGRPSDNPLIVHLPDLSRLDMLCRDIPKQALSLFSAFSPGPLTVILKKQPQVPDVVSGGLDTVAVRIPSHPVAAALLREAAVPVAAPSANRSGRPSPTRLAHVLEDLDGRVDLMIDGGECGVGLESTVVSLAGDIPVLLRPGGITLEQLRSVLGEVDVDRALYEKIGDDVKVSAPGMKYRHYAPKAPVTVVRGDPAQTAAYIAQHIGEKTGVMRFDEYRDCFPGCVVECFGSENDLGTQAREVFDRLRAFDDTDVRQIWAQCPSDEGLGLAVANRIKKAAGFSVVEV